MQMSDLQEALSLINSARSADRVLQEAYNYVGRAIQRHADTAERIEKLERALAEARRDAERYRWLCERWVIRRTGEGGLMFSTPEGFPDARLKPGLDAAIDAARQPEKDANNGK